MSKNSTKSTVSDSIGTVSASLDDALEVIGKRGRKAEKSAKKSAKSAHKSVKKQYGKESKKVVSLASRRKPKHSAAKKTVLGVLLAGGLAAAVAKVLKK
jgi:hypothetical protein